MSDTDADGDRRMLGLAGGVVASDPHAGSSAAAGDARAAGGEAGGGQAPTVWYAPAEMDPWLDTIVPGGETLRETLSDPHNLLSILASDVYKPAFQQFLCTDCGLSLKQTTTKVERLRSLAQVATVPIGDSRVRLGWIRPPHEVKVPSDVSLPDEKPAFYPKVSAPHWHPHKGAVDRACVPLVHGRPHLLYWGLGLDASGQRCMVATRTVDEVVAAIEKDPFQTGPFGVVPLIGPSGCGKTRTCLEYMTTRYGLLLVSSTAGNGGASDLEEILEAVDHVGNGIHRLQHCALACLTSRLILLVQAVNAKWTPAEWLLLQLERAGCIYDTTFRLLREPKPRLLAMAASALQDLSKLKHLAVVLDDAQVLVRKRNCRDPDGTQLAPFLRAVEDVRTSLPETPGCWLPCVLAGTDVALEDVTRYRVKFLEAIPRRTAVRIFLPLSVEAVVDFVCSRLRLAELFPDGSLARKRLATMFCGRCQLAAHAVCEVLTALQTVEVDTDASGVTDRHVDGGGSGGGRSGAGAGAGVGAGAATGEDDAEESTAGEFAYVTAALLRAEAVILDPECRTVLSKTPVALDIDGYLSQQAELYSRRGFVHATQRLASIAVDGLVRGKRLTDYVEVLVGCGLDLPAVTDLPYVHEPLIVRSIIRSVFAKGKTGLEAMTAVSGKVGGTTSKSVRDFLYELFVIPRLVGYFHGRLPSSIPFLRNWQAVKDRPNPIRVKSYEHGSRLSAMQDLPDWVQRPSAPVCQPPMLQGPDLCMMLVLSGPPGTEDTEVLLAIKLNVGQSLSEAQGTKALAAVTRGLMGRTKARGAVNRAVRLEDALKRFPVVGWLLSPVGAVSQACKLQPSSELDWLAVTHSVAIPAHGDAALASAVMPERLRYWYKPPSAKRKPEEPPVGAVEPNEKKARADGGGDAAIPTDLMVVRQVYERNVMTYLCYDKTADTFVVLRPNDLPADVLSEFKTTKGDRAMRDRRQALDALYTVTSNRK